MSIDPFRLIAPLFCLGPLAMAGVEPPEVDQEGYLTFYLDNDLFGGEDRDYTNGARLSWISGNRDIGEFGLVRGFLRKLSGDAESFRAFQALTGFEDPEAIRYNFGLSLTQLMFTPDDPYPYTQPPGQRRYAGWLALGVSLHVKDDRILNSVELSVGTTGEHAFAEPTQDFVHSAQGIPKFNGWDNQIPNEITVDLSFVQKRRLDLANFGYRAIRIDGLGEWGARLGSFQTNAYAGGFFRLGYNLPPDFSDPRLSSTAYSHRYFNTPIGYSSPWSVYAIFGGNVRLVAFDATLDGPLFTDFNTGIERRPLVGEVFFGGGIRYKAVEFSYVHTWRTEEYQTQGGISNFGSLSARVRF
ncbi:lipid A deacylase LpxR family protein [Haloferula sp.]|uniref:lipid A deacylase LpxR family protein n=1 Tax=Haloferula sp. TaxID=2497595 RepID=UPI003C78960A